MPNLPLLLVAVLFLALFIAGYTRHRDLLHPALLVPSVYYIWTNSAALLDALGYRIYIGIRTEYIGDAVVMFAIALAALALPLLMPIRDRRSESIVFLPESNRPLLTLVLSLVATALTVTVLVFVVPHLSLGAPKGLILPPTPLVRFLHYNYLLGYLMLGATVFALLGPGIFKISPILTANICTYLAYCTATLERDFILLGISYLLVSRLSPAAKRLRHPVFLLILVVGFIVFDALRQDFVGRNLLYVEMLGFQSNSLNIMTNVLAWIDAGQPYLHGRTYLDALLRTFVPGIFTLGAPLTNWFSDQYAPSAQGGYGFSLDAEAYLNGGIPVLVLVFLSLGMGLRVIIRRAHTGSVPWRFAYLYGIPLLLYAFRGDALMLMKGLIYGMVFFFLILIAAGAGRLYVGAAADVGLSVDSDGGRRGTPPVRRCHNGQSLPHPSQGFASFGQEHTVSGPSSTLGRLRPRRLKVESKCLGREDNQ